MPARADNAPLHALDDRRLQRVLQFVDQNLQNPIHLNDLAEAANLSPFHFSRAFRKAMGRPPHRFVRERRLEKAKDLVLEKKLTLAEIAGICNFSSQASFTRAFTRAVGMPPAKYRQNGRTARREKDRIDE